MVAVSPAPRAGGATWRMRSWSARKARRLSARSVCFARNAARSGGLPASQPARYSAMASSTSRSRSSLIDMASLRSAEGFPQLAQAALQQAGQGGGGLAHLGGDGRHGLPEQVVPFDRLALGLGQGGQGVGQADELLAAVGLLARRRLLGRQPRLQPRRRGVHVDGPLAAGVALAGPQP